MELSSALQRYIKIINELTSNEEGARISDISKELDVKKSSVCNAVDTLEHKDLIYRDKKKRVCLTDEGKTLAYVLEDKSDIIEKYLVDVLEVDPVVAKEDADTMSQTISIEVLCSFCRKVHSSPAEYRCSTCNSQVK